MNFWSRYNSWQEAKEAWDKGAKEAEAKKPLKKLKVLPQMPGMTEETARGLKWKSLKYMLQHDEGHQILKQTLKRPFKHGWRYFCSLLKRKAYCRDGDFFLYGLRSEADFEAHLRKKKTLLLVGFSYCQKPLECPSGRFTDACQKDPDHPVCRQCPIGKLLHALPENKGVPLIIPTIHYIGNKIFESIQAHPDKEILFLITACEMTLEMFGDWGNMVGAKGIGVRLDGRICNTMRAFELSERGIKPGLTVFTETTAARMEALLQRMKDA